MGCGKEGTSSGECDRSGDWRGVRSGKRHRAGKGLVSRLARLEPGGEIFFGHIHVVPMAEDSGLVLDSKDFGGPHDRKPVFHFNTSDVHAAREQAVAAGAAEVGPVTDGVFFTFKDPDGNLLMVADVPPAPRS